MRRLNLNVTDETAQQLEALAEARGSTLTEAVRRSVGIMDHLSQEIAKGSKLYIELPDGTRNRIILL